MSGEGRRIATRVEQMQAIRTDEEIAAELNYRHGTTTNNRKNVATARWNGERKLRKARRDVFQEWLSK